jgi:two-component system, LuxR family, response regulator FixJ
MATSDADGQGQGPPTVEPPLVAIVDDDESVRKSTRRLIQSFGYRAEAFASGAEFLASPLAVRTACLVLDVRMPDMDGLEVQRQLTARHLHVPVVFISGRASDDEERRARAAGAVDFLRKPLAAATLLEVLQKAFSRGAHHEDDA